MAKAAPKPTATLKSFGGRLLLVGAGKMGGAMLEGWVARGLDPKNIAVLEPQPGKTLAALTRRGLVLNPAKPSAASVIVIGVKPQTAPDVLPQLRAYANKSSMAISIMAGRTLAFLEKGFPAGMAVVRAMPNLPASIGRGITVSVPNAHVTKQKRDLATSLLSAVGAVEWVEQEKLLDAVTAVSGSGPAYVFLLAEALAAAGVASGLPKDLAATLARETVAGSGELLKRSTLDAATLRHNVTSPGGTTAAALQVLMGPGGFETLMATAVAMATKRSKELAG
ncbi:MAG: pyrroline-5-carboxylate reductase [Pseudolabrys sp.]|nr:pyrroline-5-carboxylate reductase [Pseudolabrys sp.]MBV9954925.1 pyrroline-5-carboxylate reductase [Pseudolabrys sp.]